MFANPFALLPLLGTVAAAAMAVVTWARGLAWIAIGIAMWNFTVALLAVTTRPDLALVEARVSLATIALLGPVTFSFLSAFGRFRWRRGALIACWIIATPVVALALFTGAVVAATWAPPWGGRYGFHGPLALAPPLVAFVMISGAFAGMLPAWRQTPPSRRKRQLGWVLFSFGGSLCGAVDVLGLLGYDALPVGWATNTMTLAIIYYAIARDRLLDVRTALQRTRAWMVFTAATFLPLLAVILYLGDQLGIAVRVVLVFAVFVVARRVEPLLGDLFGRRRRLLARTRQRFELATRAPTRADDVLRPLARALAAGFGLELTAVAVEGADGALVLLGDPPLPAPDAPIPTEPLARAELDPEDTAAPALRWLDGLDADVVVPMGVGAFLARAAPRTRTLDELERAELVRLAARADVAFTNGALHEELEAHAARLELDVAERTVWLERALQEVQAAQVRLIQAEKQSALGLLVAGASHEINNALNFIYGNAPILERYVAAYGEVAEAAGATNGDGASARARMAEAAARVAAAAGRARGLVEGLRRFARPDDRNEPRTVDVADGLRATCALLGPELRGRAELVLDLADGCHVRGFPAALNQVFLNVLLNAAQALSGGRGRIEVACAPAGDGVDVTVRDDGVGVPAAAAGRLFDPFFTTKPRASGLGLTVAHDIVVRHRGAITVGPAEPGTRVVIHLPRAGL
jgi:signal transduction histidine kinase/small basic protein